MCKKRNLKKKNTDLKKKKEIKNLFYKKVKIIFFNKNQWVDGWLNKEYTTTYKPIKSITEKDECIRSSRLPFDFTKGWNKSVHQNY